MAIKKILIVGGGIAGLTSAVAFRRKGVEVDIVELNPKWSVYGVGIIQQANVVRAMGELGLLEKYLSAAYPFDFVRICDGQGNPLATLPTERLAGKEFPANLGVARPALHKVLGDSAKAAGAQVRLGDSVVALNETSDGVEAVFESGGKATYDLVIGADGLYSRVRALLFGDAVKPRFTGQAVWRHNFSRSLTSIASPRASGLKAMRVCARSPMISCTCT